MSVKGMMRGPYGLRRVGICIFSVVAVGSVHPEEEPSDREPLKTAETNQINQSPGEQLVLCAGKIEQILSRVTDKESADRAAKELATELAAMDAKLQKLEKHTITSEEEARTLKQQLASLTHISQRCLEIFRRLYEVNAYGSTALMEVFNYYNVGAATGGSSLPEDEPPQAQLYNELADMLEDALLTMRKVEDEAGARDAVTTVNELLPQIEGKHRTLMHLTPPHTTEQKAAIRPARERLLQIHAEFKALREKLTKLPFAAQMDIPDLIDRLILASVA